MDPAEAHAPLGSLPLAAMFTTNYDTLQGRGCEATPALTANDLKRVMRGHHDERSRLFKLHCSPDGPRTLTAADYLQSAPMCHAKLQVRCQ